MENQVVETTVEGLEEEKPAVEGLEDEVKEFRFGSMLSLEKIRSAQMGFVRKRNWQHLHTPRNLMLALVGELAELFQWRKDADCDVGLPGWSEEDKEHVGQELSDVLIYLVDLAATCHVDLSKAVVKKMAMNELKYTLESSQYKNQG